MKETEIWDKIAESLGNIDYVAVQKACKDAMAAGISPIRVIEGLSKGMDVVGKRFESKEYFLSELMMAGEIFREAQEVIKPYLKRREVKTKGKVVIGTVQGDLHDIGKNIVVTLLQTSGFEVTDLGVDVSAEKFVDAVRKVRPDVLGLSALLRATVPEMGTVIKELEKAGLRKQVKIIVGGLPLNPDYAERLGADYYAEDAWKGIDIIKKVVKER